MENKKLKIGIYSLTSDDGCQMSIIDLGLKLFEIFNYEELGDFRLIKDEEHYDADVAFIEGSVVTEENEEKLKKIRKNSKIVVAIGACACLGGIPEIKNYQDKKKVIKMVYNTIKGISNPEIRPLREIVKIDFELPGCPIDGEEFVKIVKILRIGKIPKLPQITVCQECQLNENGCFLNKEMPCLGPVTLGGCKAVCIDAGYRCEGCRGPIKGANIKNMKKVLLKMMNKREMEDMLEQYGMRDDAEDIEKENEDNK